MKTFDDLQLMTDDEKLQYLHDEVDKIIQESPPHKQLKLRAIQAKCDGIRKRAKNRRQAAIDIYILMVESFEKMRMVLNGN